MPKKLPVQDRPQTEEEARLLALVSRLAGLHRDIRREQRFCQSESLEGLSAVLSLALLPLESAIIDAGRLASGKPPLVSSRA